MSPHISISISISIEHVGSLDDAPQGHFFRPFLATPMGQVFWAWSGLDDLTPYCIVHCGFLWGNARHPDPWLLCVGRNQRNGAEWFKSRSCALTSVIGIVLILSGAVICYESTVLRRGAMAAAGHGCRRARARIKSTVTRCAKQKSRPVGTGPARLANCCACASYAYG